MLNEESISIKNEIFKLIDEIKYYNRKQELDVDPDENFKFLQENILVIYFLIKEFLRK